MAFAQSWTMKEYSIGGTTAYRVKASASMTPDEATRFKAEWERIARLTAIATVDATVVDPSDGTKRKITLSADHADPETAHENMISDIDSVQDELTLDDVQVTEANTVTTGEIPVFATGKITVTIGEP